MRIVVLVFALMSAGDIRGEDGATLYKTHCANCHGASGAGRAAIKGTNLLTGEAKNRTNAQLEDWIAKGGPSRKASHAYEAKGINPERVKLLVEFIRSLQKKA